MTISKSTFLNTLKKARMKQDKRNKDFFGEKYTATEKSKLEGIEDGAQVNKIDSIQVGGVTLDPDGNKVVHIDLSEYGGGGESNTVHIKGAVDNYFDLLTGVYNVGDAYQVLNADAAYNIDAGDIVVYTVNGFINASGSTALLNYFTKDEAEQKIKDEVEQKVSEASSNYATKDDLATISAGGGTSVYVGTQQPNKGLWLDTSQYDSEEQGNISGGGSGGGNDDNPETVTDEDLDALFG